MVGGGVSFPVLKLDISFLPGFVALPFSDLLKRLYLISFPDLPSSSSDFSVLMLTFLNFLATLVALHFTPVSGSVGRSFGLA